MICVLLTATSITLLRGGSWIGVSAIADSYDFRSYNTDLTKTRITGTASTNEESIKYNLLSFLAVKRKQNISC